MNRQVYRIWGVDSNIADKVAEISRNPVLYSRLSPILVSSNNNSYNERVYHLEKFGITLKVEESYKNGVIVMDAFGGEGEEEKKKIDEIEKILNETLSPIIRL